MKTGRNTLLIMLVTILLTACGSPDSVTKTETPAPVPQFTDAWLPTPTPSAPGTPADSDAPIPLPANASVLVWHRAGGIAGFCDDLSIAPDGAYAVDTCGAHPAHRAGRLTADQFRLLAGWVARFHSFESSTGQDATYSDAMVQKITFQGTGSAQPGPDELGAIDQFASGLVMPIPVDTGAWPQAVSKAVELLAGELNLPADEIVVVSFENHVWPDRCLGVTVMGQMCAMGVTPGYLVVLQAQGRSYEIHTDETGDSLRQLKKHE